MHFRNILHTLMLLQRVIFITIMIYNSMEIYLTIFQKNIKSTMEKDSSLKIRAFRTLIYITLPSFKKAF